MNRLAKLMIPLVFPMILFGADRWGRCGDDALRALGLGKSPVPGSLNGPADSQEKNLKGKPGLIDGPLNAGAMNILQEFEVMAVYYKALSEKNVGGLSVTQLAVLQARETFQHAVVGEIKNDTDAPMKIYLGKAKVGHAASEHLIAITANQKPTLIWMRKIF